MSDWKQVKLNSLIDFYNGFAFKSSVFQAQGIPVLKIKNVKPNRIILNELAYVSPLLAETKERYLARKDDILITMSGNRIDGSPDSWVGKVARFKLDGTYLINQRVSFMRVKETLADASFLGFYLSSWEMQNYFISKANSSGGQANISPDLVKDVDLSLPSLPEQKAIASVLSSLDDKIDLLHRQNKTLEAMAETLFRQWFIEEAKEDWEDGTLDQLIDLKYGKALKQEDRSGSGYPVVASSGIVGFHNNYLVKGPSIVIGRKGTLGKVYFMEDNFYPIDTSYFIQTKTSGSNLIFEYYLLKSLDFANMNSDSAVPGLNRNIALGTQIQVPPEELILSFNGTAQPWFSKIHSNTKQIQTLEKLRDTLLPKLMSGEVRVQYQTEEVA